MRGAIVGTPLSVADVGPFFVPTLCQVTQCYLARAAGRLRFGRLDRELVNQSQASDSAGA
jgi:hypothetical protein